jgi:hypothetical protein
MRSIIFKAIKGTGLDSADYFIELSKQLEEDPKPEYPNTFLLPADNPRFNLY